MTSKAIATALGKTGLCVCPGFLSVRTLRDTADDFDRILARGDFRQAAVGRGPQRTTAAEIRNDRTHWLDPNAKNAAQARLWRKIDLLRHAFNRTMFLGLKDFEGHYAAYPAGGFYGRHKDTFRAGSSRVVSFVLYLNRNWQEQDGGRLRIYTEDSAGLESYLDVDPAGGTLVCFLSADFEHEVLLSHRERFSLSGWFRRE